MLMKKLIRYCRGTVQFTVVGPYPERFLNLCSQGGVGLWSTRRVENGITACCAQCHRPRLEYYAQKSGCALEIGRCSGMKNTAHRYRRRTGLWIGAGLLVVGLLAMSRFVWRVEVQGTERLEPEVITAALAEYGVRSGALASGIDARTVERQMQIRFEEIAWITVNVEGSRVTAIIEETVPPPAVVEDGIPTNLIAAETGFITKVEVQNGNPVVKPGDSVQAGDLLVSGIMDNKVGESRTARAGVCTGAHKAGNIYTIRAERLCAAGDRPAAVPEDFWGGGAIADKGHTGWAVSGGAYGKGAAGTVVAAAGDAAGGLLSADERGEKDRDAAGSDAAGRKGAGTEGAGLGGGQNHQPGGGGDREPGGLHPGGGVPAGEADSGGGPGADRGTTGYPSAGG